MKLIIDIDENLYNRVISPEHLICFTDPMRCEQVIKDGTPITFLKYRMKDYVFYNDKWLKERWEMEMKLLGVDFSKHDEEIIKETVESVWGKPPYTEVLDSIKTEIENDWQLRDFPASPFSCGLRRAIEIINKYRKEQTDADSD